MSSKSILAFLEIYNCPFANKKFWKLLIRNINHFTYLMFEFVKVNPTNGRSFPLKAFFTGVLRFGAVPNAVGSSESNSSKFDVSSTPLIVGTYGG